MIQTERENESTALRAERATVEGLREVLANFKRMLEAETRDKNQALRELHDARVKLRAMTPPSYAAERTPPGAACIG